MAQRSGARRAIVELIQAVALGAATFALVWLSVSMTRTAVRVATIWPANAVVLVCLLRTDLRRWPALLIASLVGDTAAGLMLGDQPIVAIGLELCNILEILICAVGLRRFVGRRIDLSQPKSLWAFGGLAVLAAPVVSGVLATTLLVLRAGAPVERTFTTWVLADALGLLVFAPALLTLTPTALAQLARGPNARKNLALLGGFVAALLAIFSQSRFPVQALIMPMLIGLAFQMELAGAALGALLVAVLAVGFLLAGLGPWKHFGLSLVQQTFMLQFNLAVTVATALAIGAALAERRRNKERLRTSLAQAEEARAKALEATRRVRMAEQIARVAYWRLVLADKSVTWSKEMYRICGLDPASPAPNLDEAMDLVHPDDRDRTKALFKEAVDAGRDSWVQARLRRPDGSWRHVVNRAACERGADGRVVAVVGAMHDVTDVKLADEAVRASEARYRLLADHSTDIIIRVDPRNVIQYISPSCRRYGYEPEDLVGAKGYDLVHPDDLVLLERLNADLFTLATVDPSTSREYRLRARSGDWIWFEGNPSIVRDEAGAAVAVITQLRDITQRRAMEDDLRAARDAAEAAATAKSEFLANMSHEIRTPLTSIMGFSSLLNEIDGLPENAKHYLGRVSTAGQSLLSVVNDILDFSKLEAGQVELDIYPFDPVHFIEDTVELFALKAADKGLSLRTAVAVDLPARIEADAGRVRQVMLNLIGNAVKFTAEGGVTVDAAYDLATERLRIAVSDTGEGVPAERRDRLFQRFSQVDGSISRIHGGTGLGLAISKNLVDLMGGEIGVETDPGEGSSFWFTLPAPIADAAPARPVAVAEEPSYEGRASHILLVDDVAANRELVRAMLSPFGHTFEEADNGADAVTAAMHAPFDLILMDLQMPGMDGFAATRAIRASAEVNRLTPILAISANVLTEHLDACKQAGIDDHIAKPLQPAELLLKVAEWTSEPTKKNIA